MTDFHTIWNGNAERVSEVRGCWKFQLPKSKMADSGHIEDWKIAISHDGLSEASAEMLPENVGGGVNLLTHSAVVRSAIVGLFEHY